MAHGKMKLGLVLVVLAMMYAGTAAQSSCTNVLVSLSPCLNYITGNSSTPPSSGCCSQLSSVVNSQPQCLCQVLSGGGSSLGISINQTQALALPGACKVQTPSISQCKNNNAASPADSPAGTAAESPNSVPSGTGSKTVPTTDDGTSSGNSIKLSIPLLLILAATCASTFRTY